MRCHTPHVFVRQLPGLVGVSYLYTLGTGVSDRAVVRWM